jgi:hypothetical protein
MKGTAHTGPADYMEFIHDGKNYRANLSWVMSNWKCIFGEGCSGHFGENDKTYAPDVACCSLGFWVDDQKDIDKVNHYVEQLTDEDWDKELRQVVEAKGDWKITYKDDDKDLSVKSRVHEGGCVFANRSNGSAGKPGCAFHVLAERIGKHFTEVKPNVCWTVPLHVYQDEDNVTVVDTWDADEWGGAQKDGTHDKWMKWWCVDTPDAYVGTQHVYQYLEAEMRLIIGDGPYETMVQEIEKRKGNYIAPMPGSVINDGRPLLPLLIGDRKPAR